MIIEVTSLNYNCDQVVSKEGGLRRDGVENKDLREPDRINLMLTHIDGGWGV